MGLTSPWQGRESRQGQAEKWCILTMMCFWLTEAYRCFSCWANHTSTFAKCFYKVYEWGKNETLKTCAKSGTLLFQFLLFVLKVSPCAYVRLYLYLWWWKELVKENGLKGWRTENIFFKWEQKYFKNEIPAVLDLILDQCNLWIWNCVIRKGLVNKQRGGLLQSKLQACL